MLEVQTDGAAAERFQIIFLFDNAKRAVSKVGYFLDSLSSLKLSLYIVMTKF